jgi:hypothetical protein
MQTIFREFLRPELPARARKWSEAIGGHTWSPFLDKNQNALGREVSGLTLLRVSGLAREDRDSFSASYLLS